VINAFIAPASERVVVALLEQCIRRLSAAKK